MPDDQIAVSANRARITEVRTNDPDNFMYSKNIFDVAKSFGWWDESKGALHMANVYGPKDSVYNTRREWRVLSLVAPSLNLDPWAVEYPFSVKPDKKVGVKDLMAISATTMRAPSSTSPRPRSWSFGNPEQIRYPGTLGEWERAISIFRCSYVVVLQARPTCPPASAA